MIQAIHKRPIIDYLHQCIRRLLRNEFSLNKMDQSDENAYNSKKKKSIGCVILLHICENQVGKTIL